MAPVLSVTTDSTLRFSRLAFASSSERVRSVATRPGMTMLAVMPSRDTSRASVLDQQTSERRKAFDSPRIGIGEAAPDEVLVMMRPHLLAFIPGNTRSVMA